MGDADMRRVVVLALSLLLGQGAISAASAAPATATGPPALALAAVVAENSSLLSAHDRSVLARLFDGHLNFGFPANQKISVKADAVVCRATSTSRRDPAS